VTLMDYLVCHHSAEQFALVGHSTGCQNSIHFLKYGRRDVVDRMKVVALQAPVSDRESLTLSPGSNHSAEHLTHAESLISQNKGNETMPRSAFWAPITASRYVSLFNIGGDDDYFSSDFTNEELAGRLGHVGDVGRRESSGGLRLLVAFSKKDEYVPESVERDVLLERLVLAMNNGFEGGGGDGDGESTAVVVARGLMLENGNHNLSKGEGDKEEFVGAVGKLMELATSDVQ